MKKNKAKIHLDETRLKLDIQSEALYQLAVSLYQGRTRGIILHPLNSIKQAHKILVIEADVSANQHIMDMLVAKKGRYDDTFTCQPKIY
ncbi:ABC transporter-related protein [Croceitalea dokdonensis DOKDO 023]|uniref:ABC transporter-related protein n=1 Tax=Croceitalea dokdonensis DOKDO 023 TaxID=1300341 RepID=A0A0P7AEW6_9FLAO|nr:hypothetical protein [Croceitalea dokdonensis]KPM30717.1 ABC transporter-related protein [Croceitalea dokdonensis DOKDO 023]